MQPGPVRAVDVAIEPDLSNAAPFLAAALVTGGTRDACATGRAAPTQAGDALREILLALMGADGRRSTTTGLTVTGTGTLHGIDDDLHDVGELTPAVAALCALADGPSHLRGIAHIRGHETDRLAALATEFNALGGDVTETEDGLRIRPAPLHGGAFRTYADHRMAHAGVVLGLARRRASWSRTSPPRPRRSRTSPPPGRGCWPDAADEPAYDEHDLESYDRPRRRTRPRTKERPDATTTP